MNLLSTLQTSFLFALLCIPLTSKAVPIDMTNVTSIRVESTASSVVIESGHASAEASGTGCLSAEYNIVDTVLVFSSVGFIGDCILTIHIPSGYPLSATTGLGTLTIGGNFADLHVVTSSNNIIATNIESQKAHFEAYQGTISLHGGNGNFSLVNVNGGLDVQDISGTLQVDATNNSVSIARLTLQPSSRNMIVNRNASIKIRSVQGEIVTAKKRAGIKISGRAINGKVSIGKKYTVIKKRGNSVSALREGIKTASLKIENVNADIAVQ